LNNETPASAPRRRHPDEISMTTKFRPQIMLCMLDEKTDQQGRRFFTGRLGHLRVAIVPNRDAREGVPSHVMFATETDATRDPAAS
jgi:hypothetical protein